MSLLTYRLRVWPKGTAPADFGTVTPLLDVSSDASHAHPHIGAPPTGDGRSIDWLSGASTVGSYTVRVLDPVTGTDTGDTLRLVTSALADAQARQQLAGGPARVEYTRGAADPAVLVSGVATAVRLAGAAGFDVAVGDARRAEATREVWGQTSASFNGVTCLIGGPVPDGFPVGGGATLPDYGPQRWKVISTGAATGGRTYRRVTLQFVRGPVKPSYNVDVGAMGQAGVDELNTGTAGYFELADFAHADGAFGWYPRLIAELRTPGAAVGAAPVALCAPLSVTETNVVAAVNAVANARGRLVAGPHAQMNLIWPEGATPPALPSVGSEYDLLLYPADVSEHNPMHVTGHVVDVIQGLWTDGGDPYDAAALATAKAAIGPLFVALRLTKSMKQQAAVDLLCGVAGLAVTFDASARRVLKQVRAKKPQAEVDAPLERITLDDLRDPGAPFDLAEQDAVTAVTFKTKRYLTGATGDAGARPLDSLVEQKYERTALTDDAGAIAGEHTQTYDLPGLLMEPTDAWYAVPGTRLQRGLKEVKLDDYAAAHGRAIFDRRTRGAITGTLPVGPGVVAQPGDEVILDLAHLPNAVEGRTPTSRRGGERVVLITRRTEVPGGADLAFEDAGTEAQPTLVPTLTLSAGADARQYVTVTLTNRAGLAALGDTIRLEVLVQPVGDATPAGTVGGVVAVGALASALADTIVVGPYDAGARVYVRARAERPLHRASAFTAWAGRTLTALAPPTSLVVTADGGDPSLLTATFTPGETDMPVEALVELSNGGAGETALATRYRWLPFPAGSAAVPLRRERAADGSLPAVIVRVRHRQPAPLAGVSASASATVTSSTPTALAAPTDPAGFTGAVDGSGAPRLNGKYGLEVTAAVVPSTVELWEAVEIAPAGGTFLAATLVDATDAVLGGRTRFARVAPADGKRRRLTARHAREGSAPSPYTAPVDVLPWGGAVDATPPEAPVGGALVTSATVTLHSFGTDCTTPAQVRLVLVLAAPLATGRTLTVTDPATGLSVATIAGAGTTSTFTTDFSAHGYGDGSTTAGEHAYSASYAITLDSTSAVLASDTVTGAGAALAAACLI